MRDLTISRKIGENSLKILLNKWDFLNEREAIHSSPLIDFE